MDDAVEGNEGGGGEGRDEGLGGLLLRVEVCGRGLRGGGRGRRSDVAELESRWLVRDRVVGVTAALVGEVEPDTCDRRKC